jgi:peptide/nickel transport system substrate-binding protein
MSKIIKPGAASPGGVTRRGLMQGAAAGALLLGTGIRPARAQGEPKRGGTLRVGKAHGQTSDSLDPATWESGMIIGVGSIIYNRLTEVDAGGSLIPELAESWEAAEGADVWTFKIRKANFHDGTPVTAKDVVASLDHHRGEQSKSAAKPLVEPVTEIKAEGEDTVVFTLAAGNADFPWIVSDYHLPIGKAGEDGKVDWTKAMGSGSYVLENFEPGVRADLSRWEDNWRSDRGWFDRVEVLAIIDPVARQNALMTGAVDAIDRVDLKTVELLKRNPNVAIVSLNGNQHFTFPMRCNEPPFDDPNVRNAVKWAVKRQELVDKILAGYGAVGNDNPVTPAMPFYNPNVPQHEYDPEKAKWFLKQSGLDSIELTLHSADTAFAGAVDAAQLIAASAGPAGITVRVERASNDGYWSNIWNLKPWTASYWSGRPTPDLMFSTAYECGVPWNESAWCNERFDELLKAARAELDEEKRREMYWEMQELVHDDGGALLPMFAAWVMALSTKIGHGEMAVNWDMDGERGYERWWFTS